MIYDPPTRGARNMAVDEAILTAVAAGGVPPTLRFYQWKPACLSLGYGQRAREADLERLHERGWEIVRRPTGGRAILHRHELTYSLALPIDHPIAAGGIIESYRRISDALLTGLQALGLHANADRMADDAHLTPVCFETPSHYEITVAGKKLIGSAQVRRKGGMLQHGSLPLTGDIADICDVLVYPDEAARAASKQDVRAHAATLVDGLCGGVGCPPLKSLLVEHISAAFGVDFLARLTSRDLTPDEWAHAEQLEREIYGSDEWTFRR